MEAIDYQWVLCYRSEISQCGGYSVTDRKFPIVEAVDHQWVFCLRSEISQCGGCWSSVGILLQIRDIPVWSLSIFRGILLQIGDFPLWRLLIINGYSVSDQRFFSMEAIGHRWVFFYRSELSQCGVINHQGVFCY